MGYKNENLKHRMGISGKPKYQCPHCKKALQINKVPFMLICSSCNKTCMGVDIIVNDTNKN
jgi:ribosomal protein L37AE/L43A